MKNILYVASEAVPFIKTGGLADVVGALPKYIDDEEFDVRVIMPYYSCIKEELKNEIKYITNFNMDLGWKNLYVGIFECDFDGIKFYFIDNEYYFKVDKPYGEIAYDMEKFIYFSKAVLSAMPVLGFKPDIIHCHDWQSGLVPVYLNDGFRDTDFYKTTKSIMTIHNLKFQGRWNIDEVKEKSGLSDYYFTSDKLEAYGDADLLKGGIVYADKVTTVSNTYANEIKLPFYGEGLDGLLNARSNDLLGIVNGIDYDVYNPENDKFIFENFSVNDFRNKKYKNKIKLQEQLGLEVNKSIPLIGICSRLTGQKGLDLIAYIINELLNEEVQLVILGTGEEQYENMFRYYESIYKNKLSANITYSDELAHKIYAASDMFLMPSLFEPCGLGQLIALRYGSLPIVRETGGLADTVIPFNEFTNEGNGFSFRNYNAHEMLYIIKYAISIYKNKKRAFNKIVERAMDCDFSWRNSAKEYERLYNEL